MVQVAGSRETGPAGRGCEGRGDLSVFSAAELDELGARLGVREVAAGAPLMADLAPVERVGFILDGRVELTARRGSRRVVVQVLQPGDVYGDIPFLCDDVPPFAARALTDAAVVEMDPDTFWSLLKARPGVARRLLLSVASRLQRMQNRLLELTAGDLHQQVAALLLDETGGRAGSVRLSQATLAQLLGATRPSVNRSLRELEEAGVVQLGYRRIDVSDAAGLAKQARH